MTTQSQHSGSSTNGSAWIGALVLVCAGILGYGILYSTNAVSDPAYLAGYYFVYALLVWGGFYIIFLRQRGKMIKFTAFVAIYVALFSGGMIAAFKQERQAVKALSSVQQEINRVASSVNSPDGIPARIERFSSQSAEASGEFGEMERFMREFIDRLIAQRNDYLLELEAIGWSSILDANRIKDDAMLSESKVMIERAKAIVDKYEKKTSELLRDTKVRIGALSLPESTKKALLAGFERGVSRSESKLDEQWELEKQVVRQFENIILMLAASDAWVVKREQILFYSNNDLARFNSYIYAIQDLSQQQEQLQKSSFAEANRSIESLKSAAQR